MGNVDKIKREEVAEWVQGMVSLCGEYDAIIDRILDGWEKGIGGPDYERVLVKGGSQLYSVLEKLRKLPVPKVLDPRLKKDFENGIVARIKADLAIAKSAQESCSRFWIDMAVSWLLTSKGFPLAMSRALGSLREKYQI